VSYQLALIACDRATLAGFKYRDDRRPRTVRRIFNGHFVPFPITRLRRLDTSKKFCSRSSRVTLMQINNVRRRTLDFAAPIIRLPPVP